MEGSHNCVMVIKEMTLLVGLTFSWNEIGDYVENVSARTEKSKPLRRVDPNSPHNRMKFFTVAGRTAWTKYFKNQTFSRPQILSKETMRKHTHTHTHTKKTFQQKES